MFSSKIVVIVDFYRSQPTEIWLRMHKLYSKQQKTLDAADCIGAAVLL